jgi:hypothetical protein
MNRQRGRGRNRKRRGKAQCHAYLCRVNDDGYPCQDFDDRPGTASLTCPRDVADAVRSRHPVAVRLREGRIAVHSARVAWEEAEWLASIDRKAARRRSKASAEGGCHLGSSNPAKAAEAVLGAPPLQPPREGGSVTVNVNVNTLDLRHGDRGGDRTGQRSGNRGGHRGGQRGGDRVQPTYYRSPDYWQEPDLPGVISDQEDRL